MKNTLSALVLSSLFAFSQTASAENITVFAAASMTNVLQQIGAEYEKAYPEDKLTFSFAGSSTLAKQIEQDAPADLFISADQKWMDYVAEKQPEKTKNIQILVENELVLIAPSESQLQAESIADIDFDKVLKGTYLAVGDDNVPVGRYAKKALEHLQLWDKVESRLSKAKDVRAVLAYIERGELPLGIVYSTDAKVSDKVKTVAVFPQESYGKVVYPAATISEKAEAKRFLDYLSSDTAKQTFEKAGFKTVE
ncbi:Molybdate-binding periplasmic protein [Bibersteinia trehalosi USDA-ARS-USMARC-188]|uniref:Molybdate-binding periplasmic protein n=2 Tax=Bibersteinia trehalosi TaxID=47735 RepID=A0A4V7IAM5_BIBTR|nr:molybdate ABC transporter substrate-binding protein [Bibersteinia trehalosi]AGH38187.1 Molybdate-binding periplasmic protein [Bibersteinia trehalosi USDA-ARS-USMARC-192]AHG82012.1 Molybdate-binding periplasmic protein [Bibersteinia trehalosi USDA-ARS-USMARC-188]AHG84319.1 Molybdate-binding periplasmic protein [Bibersteinia trehalosi USDA-ARS-USMARC-189]